MFEEKCSVHAEDEQNKRDWQILTNFEVPQSREYLFDCNVLGSIPRGIILVLQFIVPNFAVATGDVPCGTKTVHLRNKMKTCKPHTKRILFEVYGFRFRTMLDV